MTYLVSGATGWMGRSALEVLNKVLPQEQTLIGLARYPGILLLDSGRQVELIDYEDALKLKRVNGFVHTAFPTQNLIFEMGKEEYEKSCERITGWLQRFLDSAAPVWVVGISSGVLSELIFPNPRSIGQLQLYAKWKELEENVLNESRCGHLAIGRLFSASGRFMTKPSKLALGDFILSGIKSENLVIKSKILGVRNYVDAEDFIETLLFAVQDYGRLTLDSDGIEITLPDLATEVCKFFPQSSVICDFAGFTGSDFYLPSKSSPYKELASAAGVGTRKIEDQISRTMLGLRQ